MSTNTSYIQSNMNQQEQEKIRFLLANRLEKSKQKITDITQTSLNTYPVSLMQKHMLEHEAMNEVSASYNLVSSVDIFGELDLKALEKSFHCLIQSNSSLRMKFVKNGDEYQQVIENECDLKIEFKDLSDKSTKETLVEEIIEMEAIKKINFNKAPLLKVLVIQLSEKRYVMVMIIHHAIADGWSLGIMIHQLQNYYNSYHQGKNVTPLTEKMNYFDFCMWKKNRGQDSEDYWIKELSDSKILRLECDFERNTQVSYKGSRLYFNFDQHLTEEMRQFSKKNNITMSNIILTGFQILLSKYTGQKDFVIGIAFANRDHLAMNNLIGCCINTLAMRTFLDEHIQVGEFLTKVQQKSFEIMQHKNIDVYDILDKMDYEKDSRFSPLFQVMYNYENTPKPDMHFDDIEIKIREANSCNAIFDLTLSIFDAGKELTGFIEYKSEIFSNHRIEQLFQHLGNVIATLMKGINLEIESISLLSEEQEKELLEINSKKEVADKLFLDRFRKVVSMWGDREAIYYEGNRLTYNQLNEQSDKVAYYLAKQAAPRALIGVYMDKSLEVIVSLLAIFKAGMTYVPLDPSYPADRINYMIDDAGINTVITKSTNEDNSNFQSTNITNLINIDDLLVTTETYEYNDTLQNMDPESIAYIIYTSGSTGNPKGVMVPHRGLCNVIEEQRRQFSVKEDSKILQFASLCFDASVFEIVMALGNGASLYIVNKEKVLGNHLSKYIREMGITHMCVTPSVLTLADSKGLEKLEVIIVAGEACPQELVETWSRNHLFFNAYGPTEATIWTTTAQCYPNSTVTIGKPLNNVEIYVLDNHFNLVPKGHIGELYIGGIGLCKGYLNREELNRQKFIKKQFSNGYETDLYASGDLVCLNEDNNLEFVGRKDSQIKVRGFRIEVDEIRARILNYPDIQDVVVGVLKKNGMDVLYAAVKSDSKTMNPQDLQHFLLKKLPHYMVPSMINIIDDIPLTLNGKIDYKSLEEYLLLHMNIDRKIREPETQVQRILHKMWIETLGMEAIGIDEDFFELGGHSLTATKLANNISAQFHIEFSTSMVFQYPTILAMEANMEGLEAAINITPMKKVPRQERIKLSPQQKQLWFMDQMEQDNGSYNIVTPIRLEGCLNVELLEKSFRQVIERHEILKVSFHEEGGIPYQVVRHDREFRLNHYHIINFNTQSAASQVDNLISIMSKRGFNLSEDLLVRGTLVHLSDTEYVLIIIMHHIISDGWSMELFINELSKIYNQLLQADEWKTENIKEEPFEENVMEEPFAKVKEDSLQYFDYILWKEQQEEGLAKQKAYWKQTLDSEMNVLSVPVDFKRPKIQAHNGNSIEQELKDDITLKVKAFCSDTKMTTFMFMMTAFSILLHKLTGSNDIPIGVPVAGRQKKEMEIMMGFFINTLVMRCQVDETKSVYELMEDIREVSLKAYENQDVPFEDIVQMICPHRNLSNSPLVQVMLNVQNPDGIQCNLKGIKAEPYPIIQESTKFDMTLYVDEYFGKIKLRLLYDRDLYKKSRAKEYLNQLNLIIEAMLLNPNEKLYDITIQTPVFKTLLIQNRPNKAEYELAKYCLDDIVARTSALYPHRVAVTDENETLTYRELEETTHKLAGILIDKNIGKQDIVIIYATRSVKLIISILSVLKTGAAFCIFDPEYPEERLKRQIDVIAAKGVIIISDKMSDNLQSIFHTLNLCETYDSLIAAANNKTLTTLNSAKEVKDIAYVLFTSGTTGVPNCIRTAHGPVSHFLAWFVEHYNLNNEDIFGLFGGLAHDPLMREIFAPLCVGGRLVIHNRESQYDMDEYVKWMVKEKVTEVNITPSLFMMISEGSHTMISDVKHYFFGGESLTAAHIQRVRKVSPNAKCSNFYGATETPQVMGYYDVPDDFDINKDLIHLQGGIDEVQLYIVNNHGLEAGLGELGEIYIRTPHLSEGYMNNEKLNQEKFLPSNTGDECRIYKTGDLGRYQSDGSIVVEGRKDDQINIRGYRMETKEMELALSAHDNVLNAIVRPVDVHGKKQVVAYLVVKDSNKFDSQDMRRFLMSYLPMNVLPERFVLMNAIPLTPNGKIDFRKLPKDFEEQSLEVTPPRDEIEAKVKQIWANVLETDNFSIDENFFDIGGHSLLMVQIKAQLEETFNVELKLMDLFTYPSIATISDYIKSKSKNPEKEIIQLAESAHDRAMLKHQSLGKFKRLRG